jgi:hypothetical protein
MYGGGFQFYRIFYWVDNQLYSESQVDVQQYDKRSRERRPVFSCFCRLLFVTVGRIIIPEPVSSASSALLFVVGTGFERLEDRRPVLYSNPFNDCLYNG